MIRELEQDIKLNKIGHAYFLECDNEEIGYTEATEFAKNILNSKLENNPDFISIKTSEKAIKVDEIRELQKDILKKPINGERKVYIISEAYKLNLASQNCLLKTLEEPPTYITLILIAPSIYSVIGTVRSRVKAVKIPTDTKVSVREEVKDIIDNLKYKNRVEALKYAEFFDKNKDNVIEILHEMLIYCNNRILDERNKLPNEYFCDTITLARYVTAIDFAEKRISENCNFSMTIDQMLLNMRG